VYFMLDAAVDSRLFVTDHESFDDMVTEVSDAAELAALDGHPVLPGMETADAG
jgi:hypothetical protein